MSKIILPKGAIRFFYTNWRGMSCWRMVTPIEGSLRWHTGDEYHPEPQWVFDGWDHERQAMRTFAWKDIRWSELDV